MVNAYKPAVSRYPWIEGFDFMLDMTLNREAGDPANKETMLRGLGVWACADGMCDGQCSISTTRIKQDQGFNTIEQADAFSAGAVAAFEALTTTTTRMETLYV